MLFEAVGDHQLRRFKADPANKGRHHGPRPVGVDAASQLLWRRLRVVGAVAGQHRSDGFRCSTVLSPVLMTYFLVYATGAKLTEKYMREPAWLPPNIVRAHHFSSRMPPKSRLP